jgi:FkbM family methyltransferase
MPNASVVKNTIRLFSTPGMPLAYSRWLWSSLLTNEGPSVPCANTRIAGWISFSDYWWFRHGIEPAERRLIDNVLRKCRSLKPVAMDIGAHLGIFTAELAGRGFSQVHTFEPAPRTFARLKRNIDSSPCTRGSVMLNCMAVGASDGSVSFEVTPDSPATNHVCLGPGGVTSAGHLQQVAMTTLDRYCSENWVEQIDFLKIDTEGLEPYVLEGATGTLQGGRVPVLMLELCPPLLQRAGTSVAELFNRLDALGYEPRHLASIGEPGKILTLEEAERVELANFLAIPR